MSDAPPLPEIDLPDGAVITEVLRHVPGKRAIFAGHWRGRAAIFRQAERATAEMQAREWQEARRIWPYMQGARFRVTEPLAYLPELRLMVMERAPGTPLLQWLWQTEPEARGAALAPAAQWLRRYTDASESWTGAAPEGWLARAGRCAEAQPFDHLRKIESEILAALRSLAQRLDGAEWRVAVCHGDFHPNNLLRDGDRFTGIDTGGSAHMPVCKDIARFLMHLARRGMAPSGAAWCGVDAALARQFTETFALTETERRTVLPFFLGVEALLRVETPAIKPRRLRLAETVYAALRDDLETLLQT
ncbi:phosphotransferase [Roseovarius autotrophicus]|uniref:phosphotransferase n=1 Tax=Roseovarius autotrophicus TaxID=2824121 RepID=UPI001B35E045|nr:phosphotransferase [Roseovarius autotrophicus]